MVNLSSFIRYHALNTPDRVAISYAETLVTYAELYERIEVLGGFLLANHVKPGDVIAVLMKNSPAFVEIAFAVGHIGAVFLPINFRLAPEEVNYIAQNARARLLFLDEEFEHQDLESERIVIQVSTVADTRSLSAGCDPAEPVARLPQDLFRLMYTSGTTSHPKGVMHTYENFYWK